MRKKEKRPRNSNTENVPWDSISSVSWVSLRSTEMFLTIPQITT